MKAKRDDKGKLDLSHFFEGMPNARDDLVRRSIHGARKNGRLNWRQSLSTPSHDEWVAKCRASLSRHYHAFMDGKVLDEDGLTNLSGIIWNSAVLREYQK